MGEPTNAGADPHGPGWRVEELVSSLSFSAGSAWLVERWTITAHAFLDELCLELNLDLPRGSPGRDSLAAQSLVVHGAELTPDEWPSSITQRPVLGLWLPEPLTPGDRHAFGLAFSVAASQVSPWHVVRAPVPCHLLEVHVRFLPSAVPASVFRVGGVLTRKMAAVAVARSKDARGSDR